MIQRVAHVGYWEWDLETNVVVWSDETYRIFGLEPQERPMDFATVRGMVHPEDREALYSGVDVELDASVHPIAEFRIVTPSGEVRAVSAMKESASDFFTKPVNGAALLTSVERALQQNLANRREATERASLVARYESLTPRARGAAAVGWRSTKQTSGI